MNITSCKHKSRNRRSAHLFHGRLRDDAAAIVFSGEALILNGTDGERSCAVILSAEDTRKLAERFLARANRAPLPKFDGEGGGLGRTRYETNFIDEEPEDAP